MLVNEEFAVYIKRRNFYIDIIVISLKKNRFIRDTLISSAHFFIQLQNKFQSSLIYGIFYIYIVTPEFLKSMVIKSQFLTVSGSG